MNTLLASYLHDTTLESLIYIPRFNNRLQLASTWNIGTGKRVLDIGCGQGESSLVLAMVLGPSGHVTGIDVATPDYGTPTTVSESHSYIAQSVLGSRIAFVQSDAESFLLPPNKPWEHSFQIAILCHSLWYFPTRASVFDLFQTLRKAKMPTINLAEYTFQASHTAQLPHVLAAQAFALFYDYKRPRPPGPREYNVRAALNQETILKAAQSAGYMIKRQGKMVPDEDMMEGHFDAVHVQGDTFRQAVEMEHLTKAQEEEILAFGPRIKQKMAELKREGILNVRAMDVWWAVLELDANTSVP